MDSEDDSDNSSSAPSPSPPVSPAASFQGQPNVERLVQHFVAAKRSLSSTDHVWRANELVTSSRKLIEEIAVLNAKNTFARRGIDEQVDTLYDVRDRITAAADETGEEFDATIQKLDTANDRLNKTLEALKRTVVDTSLRRVANDNRHADPRSTSTDYEDSTPEIAEAKTLYDFIDETSHTELQSSLRGLIDSFHESRTDLGSTVHHLENSLKTIIQTLSQKSSDSADQAALYDQPSANLAYLFRSTEEHAAEMATLLQSLVSHYDLCVSALKHTEGGGEAAKRAIQQAEEALAQNAGGVEESLYLKTVPKPISDQDRKEMLRVMENDAREVEDVVTEIRDRNREQESQSEQIARRAQIERSTNRSLQEALEMLHEMKDIHLSSHLHGLTTFQSSWKRIREAIQTQTAELASLSNFYDGFYIGYGKMLREVDRRHAAEQQMRKTAEKARKEMQRLYDADREARQNFMDETGKFLPLGIWPGLVDEGLSFEVREVQQQPEES